MNNIPILLDEMCKKSRLELKLIDNNKVEIYNNISSKEELISRSILINSNIYDIVLTKLSFPCLSIIEFTLNKFIKEENNICLEALFKGDQNFDNFNKSPIHKEGKIIVIDCNEVNEVVELVKSTYSGQDVYIGKAYSKIVLIGDLEDERDHGISLRETIISNIKTKVYIGVSSIDGTFEGLAKGYKDAKESINIGKTFSIMPEVYLWGEMNFEKIVYNINDSYYKELKDAYNRLFKNLNKELILTLEAVLKCNLSLAKASKSLYIHRNTLMYRIEKINKETGLDIRNFRDATYLYMLYMNNKR
ncbi:helix-turn-helix domain-containing protein [Clostridium gasigenes]|uniref:PucR family transcriptional regulator n=1 Tax=Clostridium gasigenes TaxID=94869 RepID=UPI0014384BB2|nr:helix-turn-helix domain-containing protein [Clostridium gasigenes]NKF07203.1 PucR family transcriptional regulator [Clostridium gasigenes]QSW18185.1 helix-turn-helix domain-containing protein [Clostridium gasigenes]